MFELVFMHEYHGFLFPSRKGEGEGGFIYLYACLYECISIYRSMSLVNLVTIDSTAYLMFLFLFFQKHIFFRSNSLATDIQTMLVLVSKNSFNDDHEPREGTGI